LPESYSERHIKSSIVTGSVYYFYERSIGSPKQHRFIVLNIDPPKDPVIILVCASSQIRYFKSLRSNCPSETLIEITPLQYSGFTKNSIIDCNDVFLKSISEIARMLSKGKLQEKPIMGIRLIRKLRQGVILSTLVDKEIQLLLGEKKSSED
jgi:hypothetical protein